MKNRPIETEAPANSRISKLMSAASFHDSWSTTSAEVELAALALFIEALKRTPRWIDVLMALRNKAVQVFGLKDLGDLSGVGDDKPSSAYKPGDRVGIFTVFENTFDEALIGDKDKHLDVVLGIHRQLQPGGKSVVVTVTTVVHVKNLLGRLYMLPVKPMHRLIAPAVLAAVGAGPHAA